jgi:hypothetical protein
MCNGTRADRDGTTPEVVRLLETHGPVSAYHSHRGEKQGAETRPTTFTAMRTGHFASTTCFPEELAAEIG